MSKKEGSGKLDPEDKSYFLKKIKSDDRRDQFEFISEDGNMNHSNIAEYLNYSFEFIVPRDTENLYIYHPEKNIYLEQGRTFVKQMLEYLLGAEGLSVHHTNEIVEHIIRRNYVSREVLKPTPRFINFRNGVYDLEEDELLEETNGDHFFLEQIPWDYDPDAEMDQIKDFIEQMAHDEDIETLQEMMGHLLYREYIGKKAFMLYGPTDTGKSTLIRIIEQLLGENSVSNQSIHNILYDDYAPANLYGKLANVYADISDKNIGDDSKFKVLTGKDTISARRIYQDTFNFRNYATLIFSANNLPSVNHSSDAFFNRWVLIKFDNQLTDEEKDPQLLDKIVSEEEMSGLINWALEGLKKVIERGGFTESATTNQLKEEWIMESQPEIYFIENCIKADGDQRMSTSKVYNEFQNWAQEKDLSYDVAQSGFTRRVNEQMPKIKYGSMRIKGKVKKGFEGIKIIKEGELSQREKIRKIQEIIIDIAGGTEQGADEEEVQRRVEDELEIGEDELESVLKKPIDNGDMSHDPINGAYYVFTKIESEDEGGEGNEYETLDA